MTIGSLDENEKINISFNQVIKFKREVLLEKRRVLQSSSDDLEGLYGAFENLNSENEGANLFLMDYQPTDRSKHLHYLEDVEVSIGWSLEVLSEQEFNVQLEFSDKKMISQYSKPDKMEFKILKIEAFINKDGFAAINSNSDGDTSIELPTMYKSAVYDEEQIGDIADKFAQTVKAIMASNLFITIALATAL